MQHDIIDDEVRKAFPGLTDDEILAFHVANKAEQIRSKPTFFESDLFYARMIRGLGWDAFKDFLFLATGDSELDVDDYISLTNASTYLNELEAMSLYAAIYGAAAESTSKKTVSARKNSYKNLTTGLNAYDIAEGI